MAFAMRRFVPAFFQSPVYDLYYTLPHRTMLIGLRMADIRKLSTVAVIILQIFLVGVSRRTGDTIGGECSGKASSSSKVTEKRVRLDFLSRF